jgi:hypothetical protein
MIFRPPLCGSPADLNTLKHDVVQKSFALFGIMLWRIRRREG